MSDKEPSQNSDSHQHQTTGSGHDSEGSHGKQNKYKNINDFLRKRVRGAAEFSDFVWHRSSVIFKFCLCIGFLESVIIGLTYAESSVFSEVFNFVRMKKARPQLHLLEVSYGVKIDQVGFGFKGQSRNPIHRELLEARAAGNWTRVIELTPDSKSLLQGETERRRIEYATLLDPNGVILVNANANRTGQIWDPAGLVTISRAHFDLGQIKATEILPFTDFRRESPPLIRESIDTSAPVPLLGPWDTGRDPLIRWVVTPVVDGSTLLGILVAGDVVDGKSSIPGRIVKGTGSGFAGVYLSSPDEAGPWAVTQLLMSGGVAQAREFRMDGFKRSVLRRAHATSSHRQVNYGRAMIGDEEVLFAAKRVNPLLFEDREAPEEHKVLRRGGKAVIVRGIFLNVENSRAEVNLIRILEAMSRVADILGVIFVFVTALLPVWRASKSAREYLSSRAELYHLMTGLPLYVSKMVEAQKEAARKRAEERAKRRRKRLSTGGGKISRGVTQDNVSDIEDAEFEARVKDLKRTVLLSRQMFLKAITFWRMPSVRTVLLDTVVNLFGLTLLIVNLFLSLNVLSDSLKFQTIEEAQLLTIAYHLQVYHMGFGFRGVASNSAIRSLASSSDFESTDAVALRGEVEAILGGEVRRRRIEVAMLVTPGATPIMLALADEMDISNAGQRYVLNNLPERVSNLNKQVLATDSVPFQDFKGLQAPVWADLHLSSFGYSGLAFHDDGTLGQSGRSAGGVCQADFDPIVGRFAATPVYAVSDTNQTGAVKGVLISADMLNGKTILNEWSMAAFHDGFVGSYVVKDGMPRLLSSLVYEPSEASTWTYFRRSIAVLADAEGRLRASVEEYEHQQLRVDLDFLEDGLPGQEETLMKLLRGAENRDKDTILLSLRERNYFVSAVQVPPDMINFVPDDFRYDQVFLVRGVRTEAAQDARVMRISFTAGILFLALSIKIFGAIFVWRRIAGPIQHALLGMRAMLAGLPSQVALSRVDRVEKMGLRIEPYPLSRDNIAFCWFILKYENVLSGLESKERKRCVSFFEKNYPGLLRHQVHRPWCCCPKWPNVETIGENEEEANVLFHTSKDRLSRGRRSSARQSSVPESNELEGAITDSEALPSFTPFSGAPQQQGDGSPSSALAAAVRADTEMKPNLAGQQIESSPDTFLPLVPMQRKNQRALSFRPKPTVLKSPEHKRDAERGDRRLGSLPDAAALKSSLRKSLTAGAEALEIGMGEFLDVAPTETVRAEISGLRTRGCMGAKEEWDSEANITADDSTLPALPQSATGAKSRLHPK
uniref:Uncharacterized protein n=1 Tax=Chromera velia CCMP2878 TaxID=1169474 RepID=A0A0K6S6C8_9ALVE|eukprot:Cvel_16214.t1-p1 / transcript=Cvel_16214.t1 / gene=Cvel_16214 / organism=Chromera_velia_CCMP2878 / gene_product=hypothetical protein / transcript_product=hypothetical protein / location=Cvel_scaffold1239:21412-30432(-) / protein_length=1287 / sequence_SO=supercontig / SO=protein_coding / is_pseudo=false